VLSVQAGYLVLNVQAACLLPDVVADFMMMLGDAGFNQATPGPAGLSGSALTRRIVAGSNGDALTAGTRNLNHTLGAVEFRR